MTTAGYIRVSTPDQDPERQRQTIEREHTVSEWYADIEHGDIMTGRSGLSDLMSDLDEIDVVVVDETSRFGRAIQVRDTVDTMRERGVTVHIVDGGFSLPPGDEDMDLATGIWWDVTTRLAAEEQRQIQRRTREGIRVARENGKHIGTPPTGFEVEQGFLKPADNEYERVTAFVREVNRGRPKKPTARFFGFNEDSAQTILETTMKEEYPYEERYIGDEQWRRRRAENRELPDL